MSVDAHDLERAALQRKDREQLQAIAQAMGRKPPSRARKDQIIELILDAAGLPTGGGPTVTPPAAPVADASPAPATERAVPETPRLPFDSTPAPAGDAVPTAGVATPVATAPVAGAPETAAPTSAAAATAVEPTPAVSASTATAEQPVSTTAPVPRPDRGERDRVIGPRAESGGGERGRGESGRGESGSGERGRVESGRGEGDRVVESARREDARVDDAREADGRGERPRAERHRDQFEGDGDGGRDDARSYDDRGQDDRDGSGDDGRSGFGDPNGEREGGSRRRRRRGRDKDRGERSGVAGFGAGTSPSDRGEDPGTSRDHAGASRDQGPTAPAAAAAATTPSAGPSPSAGGAPQGGGQHVNGDAITVAGYLDLRDEGYGFLRVRGYLASKEDVYVPAKYVRQFSLRKGDHITGISRPAGRGEKNPALLRVDEVNGTDPELARNRPRFEDLTPLFPDTPLRLSRPEEPFNMTARIVDLISPIGKGQRGLIVSPPKAGKTTIMKSIAQAIEANNPEVKLIILLVDERPEEVTDMRRSIRGEVIASTFDRPADEHTHVAEMTIERAKRLVEGGHDVVIILDGITRLARAYNIAAPATGRIMSGGIDTGALYPPKKFFGAARNVEEGGSLTILATALVETGSRMDEVIFEEFKGTGNMELRLDRRLAEKRIYPAIDVDASSTRHEELLFDRRQLQNVWRLRRVLSGVSDNSGAGLELLIDRMKSFKTNDEFLAEVAKAPSN